MSAPNISIQESFTSLTHNLEPIIKSLQPWFVTRRWSGLSGIRIVSINVVEQKNILSTKNFEVFATLVEIRIRGERDFKGETILESRLFYIPLNLKLEQAEDNLLSIRCADGFLKIREAEYSKEYNNFLLCGLIDSLTINVQKGFLVFKSIQKLAKKLEVKSVTTLGKGDTTNIIVKIETQSNQTFIVKTYKKISDSNPEPEILAVLTEAGFSNSPRLIGQMIYNKLGKLFILSIVQRFEENDGDGRQPFITALQDELKNSNTSESRFQDSLKMATRLGEIIASMHHALGHSTVEGFGASLITEVDVKRWKSRIETSLHELLDEISQNSKGLDSYILELVTAIAKNMEKILRNLIFLNNLCGKMKIRTHQDLHLAQLLVKLNNEIDFIVIDFEGDPQRTGEDRREKECPLRDLGTMVRSFSYLRYYVLNNLLEEAGQGAGFKAIASYDLEPYLDFRTLKTPYFIKWLLKSKKWEDKIRKSMIEGYLAEVERLGDNFFSEANFETANSIIKLWELEKAILEAKYEFHHRPQNLIIPLAGLLTLPGD